MSARSISVAHGAGFAAPSNTLLYRVPPGRTLLVKQWRIFHGGAVPLDFALVVRRAGVEVRIARRLGTPAGESMDAVGQGHVLVPGDELLFRVGNAAEGTQAVQVLVSGSLLLGVAS